MSLFFSNANSEFVSPKLRASVSDFDSCAVDWFCMMSKRPIWFHLLSLYISSLVCDVGRSICLYFRLLILRCKRSDSGFAIFSKIQSDFSRFVGSYFSIFTRVMFFCG